MRAFVIYDIAGEVEVVVRLAVLMSDESGVGDTQGFLARMDAATLTSGADVALMTVDVHASLERDMANVVAWHSNPDRRKRYWGAGALGVSSLRSTLPARAGSNEPLSIRTCYRLYNLARQTPTRVRCRGV